MTDIKWQEPPPARNRDKWGPIGAELRERPGAWALVAQVEHRSTAGNVKRTLGPGFEVAVRIRDDKRLDLYVRFVGEGAR